MPKHSLFTLLLFLLFPVGWTYAQKATNALLFQVEGDVFVLQKDSSSWRPVVSTLDYELSPGDSLKTGYDGSFVLFYKNSLHVKRGPFQTYAIESISQRKKGNIFLRAIERILNRDTATRPGSRRGDENPELATLRWGKVLSASPTISLVRAFSDSSSYPYSIKIAQASSCRPYILDEDRLILDETIITNKSEIAYPEYTPALKKGLTYNIFLSSGQQADKIDHGCFQVATESEVDSVAAIQHSLQELYVEERESALYFASWLADNEYYSDALQDINSLEQVGSQSPVLFKLRNYIYFVAGPRSLLPDPCDLNHVYVLESCKSPTD